ncbi:MAG TPA: winged helix-turn-helix domain-containing protein [Solirubrobacteraceae bacterium]|jgi:DNA-binding transcriptional ArsR family regulator|nr:winged helix-turn-helix domain-containing protein [Solirubrobacteraceae bacterium]
MPAETNVATIAGLLADPSRTRMLQALMDSRARTTGELARLAKIAPSTASEHLGRLADGRLLAVRAQGRHRYWSLAGPEVATLIETIMALAPNPRESPPRASFELSFIRTCYDHLAGTVATALYDQLQANDTLTVTAERIELTTVGTERLQALGINPNELRRGRRPLARPCLDWTERRNHLAGALGAALLNTFRERKWIAPRREPRALRITETGRRELVAHFGIDTANLSHKTNKL